MNSSGFLISSAVIRISTALVIEIASSMSSRSGGAGTISRTTMPTTPSAMATSPRPSHDHTCLPVGVLDIIPLKVTSAMR